MFSIVKCLRGPGGSLNFDYYAYTAIVKTRTTDLLCGGAIIAPRWVITAANCVPRNDRSYYQIKCGSQHLKDTDDVIVANVIQVYRHPHYDPANQNNNNIALLHLDTVVDREPCQSIKLARSFPEINQDKKISVDFSGWGSIDKSSEPKPSDIIRRFAANILKQNDCQNRHQNKPIFVNNFCTSLPGYDPNFIYGACAKDNGDPIVVKRFPNITLIGINSENGCNTFEFPEINTNVLAYRPWIRDTTKLIL
ncbi:putative serine protease 29 [Oppia nitens]|uniref:putative serine protease 29 n=1 Tax=Oppia nitens TaxID=1686743 RepID=UPI0023DC09E0|nr:putative serine protease 29 [Oppia nitens]